MCRKRTGQLVGDVGAFWDKQLSDSETHTQQLQQLQAVHLCDSKYIYKNKIKRCLYANN